MQGIRAMKGCSIPLVSAVVLVAWTVAIPARGGESEEKLIRAIKWQELSSVVELVERGADVRAPDQEGLTPLFWAASSGRTQIVERLIAAGADPNGRTALGLTPLCVAAQRGWIDIVKVLLEKGADVNARTDSGWSALFYCALSGAFPIVEVVLDQGAEVDAQDAYGTTPLIIAGDLGRDQVLKLLLDRGADVNRQDKGGTSALISASYRGHSQVVKLLLERGANVNITNAQGRTPLMLASMTGHTEVVDLLLGHGANIRTVANDGSTALGLAYRRGHSEIVKKLTQRGVHIDAGKNVPLTAPENQYSVPSGEAQQPESSVQPGQLQRDEVEVLHVSKIAQLVGEFDREKNMLTGNRTLTRFKLMGTDLGVPFRHMGRTYLLFGDTGGLRGGDAIAYTTDTSPEDGLDLTFVHDEHGIYKPIKIPGISQSFFEVPTEGVSVDGNMYVYHTTDHTTEAAMGRSVVAVSKDDGHTFRYLYDLSTQHFINVSIVEVDTRQWKGLPEQKDIGLVMFGSGTYRKSDVRLAFQPAARIESRESIRFFAGVDIFGMPVWSASEDAAKPLFHEPCIGEFSVSFNRYIRKWIMLYHCGPDPQGIQIRTSDQPWGAWSASKVLFEAGRDDAYCRFIHAQWDWKRCDILHDPGREYRRGAMYGPYQFEDLAVGDNTSTTIYFTVSTWNPYTVILMKATLRRVPQESPLPDCAFRTSPTGSQYEFPVTVYSEGQRMNR